MRQCSTQAETQCESTTLPLPLHTTHNSMIPSLPTISSARMPLRWLLYSDTIQRRPIIWYSRKVAPWRSGGGGRGGSAGTRAAPHPTPPPQPPSPSSPHRRGSQVHGLPHNLLLDAVGQLVVSRLSISLGGLVAAQHLQGRRGAGEGGGRQVRRPLLVVAPEKGQ